MRLLLVTLCAIITYLLASMLRPAPAAAWYKVCNGVDETVHVAVVDDSTFSDDIWAAGWYNIASNKCKMLVAGKINPVATTIWVYAFSAHHRWAGKAYFCVDPVHKFNYRYDQLRRHCPTGVKRGFAMTNTSDDTTDTLRP